MKADGNAKDPARSWCNHQISVRRTQDKEGEKCQFTQAEIPVSSNGIPRDCNHNATNLNAWPWAVDLYIFQERVGADPVCPLRPLLSLTGYENLNTRCHVPDLMNQYLRSSSNCKHIGLDHRTLKPQPSYFGLHLCSFVISSNSYEWKYDVLRVKEIPDP